MPRKKARTKPRTLRAPSLDVQAIRSSAALTSELTRIGAQIFRAEYERALDEKLTEIRNRLRRKAP